MTDKRLVFDVWTLTRSGGQASGIVRVVRELARWALANRPDTVFVIHDARSNRFRIVAPEHLDAIVNDGALIDYSTQPGTGGTRRRDRLPAPLRQVALWMRNPRRRLFVALERYRLAGRRWPARIQDSLLNARHRSELTDTGGGRRTLLPFDMAVGDGIDLDSRHLLLCPGSDWGADVMAYVAGRKAAANFKLGSICYDTIPIMHPEFYPPGWSDSFRRMFDWFAVHSDLVFVTANRIADDIRAYCADNAIATPRLKVFRPGADLVRAKAENEAMPLPQGLEAGRYALFVATIEPRKGHRLLHSVWKRLLAQGIPQAADFKLVFVGRRGWMMDEFMAELEAEPFFGRSLLALSGVDDTVLDTLYRNAAFGVFPSLYEGYGLPVVELFRHGKAVIASTGGAVPEVVGDLSPCLDPLDEDAWSRTLGTWIARKDERASHEKAIAERFSHPAWDEAAAAFFGMLEGELTASPEIDTNGRS